MVGMVITNQHTLTMNASGSNVLNAAIVGSQGSLVMAGSGTLTLTGASTYSGLTLVNSGTLVLGSGGSFTNTSVTVNNGASFGVNGGTVNINNLQFGVAGGTATTSGSLSNGTITVPNMTLGEGTGTNATFTQNGGTLNTSNTFVGFTGQGDFVQTGGTHSTGKLTLSNGEYDLDGGNLTTGYVAAVSGTNVFNFNGGTLECNSEPNSSFLQGLSHAYVQAGGAIINTNNSNITIAQVLLSGGGNGGLTKSGGGILTLSSANPFLGPTTISDGTINLANANALQYSVAVIGSSGTLTFDPSVPGIFSLGGLSGNLLLENTASAPITLSIVPQNGICAGVMSGTGQLDVNHTLTLTGANTYTGGTDVEGSQVSLTVPSGVVKIGSGGTFLPGNSVGPATTGNATWAGGGNYQFDIDDATGSAGSHYSQWNVAGTLSITSGSAPSSVFTIMLDSLTAADMPGQLADFNPGQSYTWEIANTTGGISGFNLADLAVNTSGFANAFTGSFSVSSDGRYVDLSYTGVPEPAALPVAALAAGLLIARRPRRTLQSALA
jgi:fibronectin-binding autotransporter adhesin